MNLPTFIGWQELPPGIGCGKMALFNLQENMGQHPKDSTVSDRTLMQHGWSVVQVAELVLSTLRSNGSSIGASSCEAASGSVFELSVPRLPAATDVAGKQAIRSL